MSLLARLCLLFCILPGCGRLGFDAEPALVDGGAAVLPPDANGNVAWLQQAYVKASTTDEGDLFGARVSISNDGNTLVVGTFNEDSNATGVGGDQSDNSAITSGAVYVFTRSGERWIQEAYIKPSNTHTDHFFGIAISISGDGNTLAVGGPGDYSPATGIGGNQSGSNASYSGAVYVFVRDVDSWTQQAYIKASNAGSNDIFGEAMALSDDGNTLAVAAEKEDGGDSGVNGDQNDNSAAESGAAYIFSRSGVVWSQQAYIKASNPGVGDLFGSAISLSGDGKTLAVGAHLEDSGAAGINGSQADSSNNSGAAYVFSLASNVWSQEAYIKPSNTGADDEFARTLSLAFDGSTLAVGAALEDGSSTGVDGASDNAATDAGAVYVFARGGSTWSQNAYIKASNAESLDWFGGSVAISGDGKTLAVGAPQEASAATGVGGNETDNSKPLAGAAYTFVSGAEGWQQRAYLKASNSDYDDQLGGAVALSADGNTLVAGAILEDSASLGVNGPSNEDKPNSGATYLFSLR